MLSSRIGHPDASDLMNRVREMRKNFQEGDIVSAKFIAGSSTIIKTGKLGRSLTVPYIVESDGTVFPIHPILTMPSGNTYTFASMDLATPAQRDEYLQNAEGSRI